jgi:hypothetical protein
MVSSNVRYQQSLRALQDEWSDRLRAAHIRQGQRSVCSGCGWSCAEPDHFDCDDQHPLRCPVFGMYVLASNAVAEAFWAQYPASKRPARWRQLGGVAC